MSHPTNKVRRPKKEIQRPTNMDARILDKKNGKLIGTIRVKPTGILWKRKYAKGPKPFYRVSIKTFAEWIETKETNVGRISG